MNIKKRENKKEQAMDEMQKQLSNSTLEQEQENSKSMEDNTCDKCKKVHQDDEMSFYNAFQVCFECDI